MYGSDAPFHDPGVELRKVEVSGLDEQARRRVLGLERPQACSSAVTTRRSRRPGQHIKREERVMEAERSELQRGRGRRWGPGRRLLAAVARCYSAPAWSPAAAATTTSDERPSAESGSAPISPVRDRRPGEGQRLRLEPAGGRGRRAGRGRPRDRGRGRRRRRLRGHLADPARALDHDGASSSSPRPPATTRPRPTSPRRPASRSSSGTTRRRTCRGPRPTPGRRARRAPTSPACSPRRRARAATSGS